MSDQTIWKTKLAARIHDPAEKALVLLRDPAGHEGGTSLALKRLLGLDQLPEHIDPDSDDVLSTVIFKNGLPSDRSEEHTSELQSRGHLVCRLLLDKKTYTAAL